MMPTAIQEAAKAMMRDGQSAGTIARAGVAAVIEATGIGSEYPRIALENNSKANSPQSEMTSEMTSKDIEQKINIFQCLTF
jgi:hypothetical protein